MSDSSTHGGVGEALARFGETWWVALPAAGSGQLRLWYGCLGVDEARRLSGGVSQRPVVAHPDRVVVGQCADTHQVACTLHPVSFDHARVLSLGLYPWQASARVREVLCCSEHLCRAGLALAGLSGWPGAVDELVVVAAEVWSRGAASPVDVFSMIQRLRAAGFDALGEAGAEVCARLADGWGSDLGALIDLARHVEEVGRP